MPRVAKKLTPVELKHLPPGTHAVGGVAGLMLNVKESGARSWILRVAIAGKRREIGLGPFPEVSLGAARERASVDKEAIRQGRDPAAARAKARAILLAESKPKLTVKEAITKAHEAHAGRFSSEKNGKRWAGTLLTHVVPHLGDRPLESVTDDDVLAILRPLWITQNETATKVRSRFQQVFQHAIEEKLIPPMDNPCLYAGLRSRLKKLGDPTRGDHQPSVPWRRAPEFYSRLGTMPGTAALALRFLMLVGCRSAEVTDAVWSEFDLDAEGGPLFTVPAERTKTGRRSGRDHLVPPSRQAVALLKVAPRMEGSPFVFPAPRGGAFSNMALSAVMRRMHATEVKRGEAGFLDADNGRPAVPHGLRASFRSWAAAKRIDWDVAEMILGHETGTKVERAYNRDELLPERRVVLQQWADFVTGAAPESL